MSDAAKPTEEPKVAAAAEEAAPAPVEVTEATEAPEADQTENKESSNILKTKARIDLDNHRNNRKFDPTSREVTDDPVAIRKQVEFYFGDFNFPQDKFMWEQCEGTENKPIALSKIHSFKRMRSFQPYSAIVAALRDSTFLDIEGEEGQETIKRKTPYKPMAAGKAKTEAATVYIKGFGDESPTTQFDLESFFSQFGEVKGLKLRRTNEGLFKGSVFVTFGDEEEAKKFTALDPAPKWQEHDLKIMSKNAYCQEKNDLIRQGKLEPNTTNPKKFFEGREGQARGRGNNRAGPHDRDDWKKRRDYDQKSGFRDRRGGGRGRGGRGRGGRGRDGGRGDRGDRFDRNAEKKVVEPEQSNPNDVKPPQIQSTTNETNGKRARDDDGANGEPAAKKVDAKES